MSNTFVNSTMVARECLRQLENNLVMARLVHRGYEEEWQQNPRGWKVGSSVTIKAPVYFRVKDGAVLDAVNLVERDTTFTVSSRKHVAWAVTAQEMTLNIDKFSERFITPAMQALANYIDLSLLGLYTDIPNQVGTPGTTPSSFYTFAQAQARLVEEGCPPDNLYCVIDPQSQAKLADHNKVLFHQAMVSDAIRKGKITNQFAGFEMYTSQNVNTHTCGTGAGTTIAVDDASIAEGDETVTMDNGSGDWTTTLKHGDIFTIADVNSVNPISGQSTGSLRQFCVDADVSAAGTEAEVTCTPGTDPHVIYSSGASEDYLPYQNIDTLHVTDAAVTVAGTASLQHKVNLAFHRDCLGLVMVPLEMPASVSWKAQESYNGYTIRVIRDYDVTNDQEYIRFDVLFGMKTLNPFLGCRIAG